MGYLFKQFTFKIYYNYLLYSIFYYLKVYVQSLQDSELKKRKNKNNYFLSFDSDLEVSQNFYINNIFRNKNHLKNKISVTSKKNTYLRVLCSSQINSKVLDDSKFSVLLNNLRSIYRLKKKRKNSLLLLNKLIKGIIPLSKIIYQRRGRSLIPLMTFIYSSDIRNSLGLKHIFRESNKVSGFGLSSYENKLLMYLVDILISKRKNDLIYQFEQDSEIRKEAYNRGYFFKTLKAQSKKNLKKTPALVNNPQKHGTCVAVFTKTPRKPNSALRKVAKVRLVNSRIVTVYIPGEGHNISRFSDVLIAGRRIRDLPGVKYGALRGKLDLASVQKKRNGRSKYGRKKEKVNTPLKKKKKKKKKKKS